MTLLEVNFIDLYNKRETGSECEHEVIENG